MDTWFSDLIETNAGAGDAAASPLPGRVTAFAADALDALPVAAFVANAAGGFEYISHGWTSLTGYSTVESRGFGYLIALDAADRDRLAAVWASPVPSGTPYTGEYALRRRDGGRRWVRIHLARFGATGASNARAWFGTITDIDDYRRVCDQLKHTESIYRAFAGTVPGNTWTANRDGELLFIGDNWLQIDAVLLDRALGNAWLESVHDDDRPRVAAAWQHAIRSGEPYHTEFRVLYPDGTYHWLLVRALPVRDEGGEIVRWVGLNLDIEDRHASDRARDMYASLVERSSDFIALADTDERIAYFNAAGRELLGFASLGDVVGRPIMEFVFDADRERIERDVLPELRRTGRWQGEVLLRHAVTGRPIPVTCTAFALTAADGTALGLAAVCRDQREQKRVEDGMLLLDRTGAATVDSLDYQLTLSNIAHAFIGGFAALCVIDVMPADAPWQRTVAHRDPGLVHVLQQLPPPPRDHPVARAIAARESAITTTDEAWAAAYSSERVDAVRVLGMRSMITVPVVTPAGDVVGALACALDATSEREDYGPGDLGFVEEVARRAGAAIANVQRYERERRVALELQAAALPARLPAVAGVRLDAAYRPGSAEANIGGDWYDAFLLDDGRLVITTGDVLGHGLHAAVSMTKLRLAMQSAAMVAADPHTMLQVADATLRVSDPDSYATAIAAVYDPATRTLRIASAGHPGPMIRAAGGRVEEVDVSGLMLGLRRDEASDVIAVEIPAGSVVMLYTDGLLEFTRDAREGVRRLTEVLSRGRILASDRPAEALVAEVLAADNASDDIAVLLATFD